MASSPPVRTYQTGLVNVDTNAFYALLFKKKQFGDDDIIIAFMGQTGSGKSQIIDTLTGEEGRRAGDSLASVTQDLTAYRILDHERYGSRIVLVDTPGFDDSSRTDAQILELIGDWLKKTYKKRILLSGIVYVHRITDPRMAATPHRNLLTFAELTGPRCGKNVVLATTMWDKLNPKFDDGDKRENGLKGNYWKVMIHNGAAVERFLNDSVSAWSIVDNIIKRTDKKAVLLFQEETVDQKRHFLATAAGTALTRDLNQLIEKHERTIQESTVLNSSSESVTPDPQESKHPKKPAPTPISTPQVKPKPSPKFNPVRKKIYKPKASGGTKKATHVTTKGLDRGDIVILVMGPTGTGKSTFISRVTGVADPGFGLASMQTDIRVTKTSFEGYNIAFVEIAGFDDTHKSDTYVLQMMSDWLEITYKNGILVSGLLYFHRISDARMSGTLRKNLLIFDGLCGENVFENVVIVTTMWDRVNQQVGASREKELKSNYWNAMIGRGSRTGRFTGTRDSALNLVAPFLKGKNSRFALLIQKELVDFNLLLGETQAGRVLLSEIKELVKQQETSLEQMWRAVEHPDDVREYEKLERVLLSLLQQMADLEVPVGRRLMTAITSTFSPKR